MKQTAFTLEYVLELRETSKRYRLRLREAERALEALAAEAEQRGIDVSRYRPCGPAQTA